MTKKNKTDEKANLVEESEFKGKPVLALRRHEKDGYPLKFGVLKARLILANVEAIRAFCEKHEAEKAATAT